MDGIIEYVDINWNPSTLEAMFKSTLDDYDVGRSSVSYTHLTLPTIMPV